VFASEVRLEHLGMFHMSNNPSHPIFDASPLTLSPSTSYNSYANELLFDVTSHAAAHSVGLLNDTAITTHPEEMAIALCAVALNAFALYNVRKLFGSERDVQLWLNFMRPDGLAQLLVHASPYPRYWTVKVEGRWLLMDLNLTPGPPSSFGNTACVAYEPEEEEVKVGDTRDATQLSQSPIPTNPFVPTHSVSSSKEYVTRPEVSVGVLVMVQVHVAPESNA